MGITLDLPDDLADELTAEAAQLGMPLCDYLLRILASSRPSVAPQNGADLVDYWRNAGLIGGRADVTDSGQYARNLRAQAERRSRP